MEQQTKKKLIINVIFLTLSGLMIYISCKFLFQYLFPFVVATFLAWAVQRPSGFISSKTKLKKSVCAVGLAAFVYMSFVGILFFAFSKIGVAVREVLKELPLIFDFVEDTVIRLKNTFTSFSGGISDETAHKINEMSLEMIGNLKTSVTVWLSDSATSFAGWLPSFLFGCVVTLVASCYIAKDFVGLSKFIKEISGEKVYSTFIKIKKIFVTSILKIIKGYFILMGLTFAELTVGFMILKIKHAVLIAFLVALIDLLPVFGTGAILVPWSVAEFLGSNNGRGLGIIIIYVSVCIIRNFLEPKVIGNQIGINPLFTLIAMFAGLKLFGFWGLLLFPVTLIVVIKYYKNEMEHEVLQKS